MVPSNLTALTALTYLDLSRNLLSGSLPVNLSAVSKLSNLLLFNNSLNGTVPSLASLTMLRYERLVLSQGCAFKLSVLCEVL